MQALCTKGISDDSKCSTRCTKRGSGQKTEKARKESKARKKVRCIRKCSEEKLGPECAPCFVATSPDLHSTRKEV